ncbi:hypothetical protein ACVW16_004164 [Bradyrhizobium sp. USDA 4474]
MNEPQAFKTLLVRLPSDVKAWLEREAAYNLSSQTSEIVRSVRHRMEAERHAPTTAPEVA